ncbi:hypothetical protein Droror1_Dr00022598 [Drosera rotundifolia]
MVGSKMERDLGIDPRVYGCLRIRFRGTMATPYMTAAVLLRWVRSSLHSTISCFSSGRSIFISITLIRAPCFGLMATIEKLLLPWRTYQPRERKLSHISTQRTRNRRVYLIRRWQALWLFSISIRRLSSTTAITGELGIGIVAHGPLGRGFFTHGYDDEGNARCKSHDRRYRGSVEEDSVLS